MLLQKHLHYRTRWRVGGERRRRLTVRYNQTKETEDAKPTMEAATTAPPVNVTESAASRITQLLDEEKKAQAGLRVFVQGGGCSGFQYGLMIEEGAGDPEADRIFESNGVTLFIDPISIRYLAGAEVDFVDNLMGGGFTIKNPNAKTTCGCGQSFGV